MAIGRTIYTAGFANIVWTKDPEGSIAALSDGTTVSSGTVAIGSTSLILQSLDFSHDVPKETITAFGTSKFVRVSNEAESAEIEMELYPSAGIGGGVKKLALAALATYPTYVNVYSTAGNLSFALMSSLEFEASVGDVPTMSMTFMGNENGRMNYINPSSSMDALNNVGTTATISLGLRGNTALGLANADAATMRAVFPQSASFSWDSGVESIGRLGEKISEARYFGTPPGEASIDCEGLTTPGNVQWLYLFVTNSNLSTEELTNPINADGTYVIAENHALSIGAVFIDRKGETSSNSVSIAVGDVFGTYSTTTEGTAQGVIIG
jgi:hypothetical protein